MSYVVGHRCLVVNLLDALPEDSKFFRLIETATVLTDKQAKIAVFHPDHARIHLERSDAPGSIDAPCMYTPLGRPSPPRPPCALLVRCSCVG